MSDIDNATGNVAPSNPVAPPSGAGDQPGSTPASADTAASEAKPQGTEPDKQSRRDARAFATYRRENRELARALGRMEAEIAALRAGNQSNQTGDGQQPPQQEMSPAQVAAFRELAEQAESVRERLYEAGEEIEGFDKVMTTILADNFPMTRVLMDFLGDTDQPVQMAQWLSDNREEARRISRMSDAVAVRALERAEKRLAEKPAPKTTNTPPPPPTVNGRSTPSFDPEKASMEEYKAYWRERRAKAGYR